MGAYTHCPLCDEGTECSNFFYPNYAHSSSLGTHMEFLWRHHQAQQSITCYPSLNLQDGLDPRSGDHSRPHLRKCGKVPLKRRSPMRAFFILASYLLQRSASLAKTATPPIKVSAKIEDHTFSPYTDKDFQKIQSGGEAKPQVPNTPCGNYRRTIHITSTYPQ